MDSKNMINYLTLETIDARTDEWLTGLEPYNTHDYTPDPTTSALLVIDCQNFFVSDPKPDGAPILPRINGLIWKFHEIKRPVIFTRHMHKKDKSDFGMIGEWWPENIIEDTPESEIHKSLDVGPDDIVIRKNRYSAFYSTGLDEILRGKGVRDIVISGVMTNLCCETTARDAFMRDYRVFYPADAMGTASEAMHFASLMNVAFGFGVVLRVSDIINALSV
jgi:nicotinamidase-related amidase